ncbi:MAG: radical SAM protein [Deltaproteobacteria bacterium]|nr:MAG: radical SAM protein [Deltaproteobacteria bacterium]RLC23242.1 MAG: radical SAM protein [Deltaproteobacteria bacterium]
MNSVPFEMGPIRPVDEADSLLIRTTRGCPWNRCTFCTLYDDMKFSLRSVSEIKKDILAAKEYFKGHPFETCFLQDGDSFVMRTKDLIEILETLRKAFPSLKRISSYGRAQTMVKKTPSAMKEIFNAGLNKLYCGMESGSVQVLESVRKGITPESIIKSACMAREAGMDTTQFIILGLGGKKLSKLHAIETAKVLNEINPDYIRLLTIGVKPGSGLDRQMAKKEFSLPSEAQIIAEQRLLLEHLEGITSHYANHHSVDLLLEIRGQLPGDKNRLLAILDRFLSLSDVDQINFVLGRRLGYYRQLSDMKNDIQYRAVEKQTRKIRQTDPDSFEEIFHNLRIQVI